MSAEKKRSSALRQLTWTRTAAAANRANPAAETVIELEPAAVLVRTSSSAAADEELERLRDEYAAAEEQRPQRPATTRIGRWVSRKANAINQWMDSVLD